MIPSAAAGRKPRKNEQLEISGSETLKQVAPTRDVQERAAKAMQTEGLFFFSPTFRDPKTQSRLSAIAERVSRQPENSSLAMHRTGRLVLGSHSGNASELLGRAEQKDLFLAMNYVKWRANVLRARLDPAADQSERLAEIDRLNHQAAAVRNELISCNLRLVLSIAHRCLGPGITVDDLFSEGVLILMRAIDRFDVERGFQFSTYAYPALLRHLSRYRAAIQRRSQFEKVSLADSTFDQEPERVAEVDPLESLDDRSWPMDSLIATLTAREQKVIRLRFGLASKQPPCSFQRLGEILGVSKERARQLTVKALEKLRLQMIDNKP